VVVVGVASEARNADLNTLLTNSVNLVKELEGEQP